ncbi:MAG: filamentous hemagglutinin N-terminal domain-containing protein, partial [Rhodoferax sp.]
FSAHSQAALPTGATVANGVVGINTFRDGMQVTNSPGAIINWNSFSIASGQTVRFDQLTAGSAVLNRVTGNSASNILGTLQSNGRVFLLNPNGIVFGAGARIDTAGLLASTLNISDEDFLAGNYRFSCFNSITCEAGVDVLNPGMNRIVLQDGSQITTRNAGNGGQVWLIARDRVTSEKGSTIDAPGGQVMAAAAREVTVSSPALGQMTFTLTGPVSSQIDLAGDITVERGAAGFFADNIRLAGKVLARSEVDAAGQIVAKAGNDITVEDDARLSVSGTPGADAGAIRLNASRKITVAASVELAADGGTFTQEGSGGQGGIIELKAAEVELPVNLSRFFSPVQMHARGFNTRGLDPEKSGEILVEETGSFEYSALNAMTFSSSSNTYLISEGTPLQRVGFDQNYTMFSEAIKSGDGQIAIVSDSQNTVDRVGSIQHRLTLLNADGSVNTQRSLATDPYTGGRVNHGFEVIGLSKGGWVLVEYVRGNSNTYTSTLHFISSTGNIVSSISEASSQNRFIVPLLNGGIQRVDYGSAVHTVQVFDARGVLQTDTVAALQGEAFDGQRTPILFVDQAGAKIPRPELGFNGNRIDTTFTGNENGFTKTMGVFEPNGFQILRSYGASGVTRGEQFIGSSSDGNLMNLGSNQVGFSESQASGDSYRAGAGTTTFGTLNRQLVSSPIAATPMAGSVLTPPLLASQPSARNGVASTGGLTPPSGVGPTLPDLAPTTPAPAQPVAGVNPAAPAASLPPPRQGPAPRLDLFEKPAPSAPTKPPAGVSAKAAVAEPLTPAQEKELLDTATQVAEDLLGKDAADQLATAKTPEQRGRIAQEMLYAMNVGPKMYEVTRDLNDDMRGALFTSLSDIQKLALADDPALADGLKNALEKQREGTNPDGSPRGTAMQEPLRKLQRELAYAATPVERERVQRRMTRELIHSAKEQAGETVDRKADLVIEEPDGTKVRFTEAGDLVRS